MMNILHSSEILEGIIVSSLHSHACLIQNNREILQHQLTSKRREQRAVLPIITFVTLAEVQQQEHIYQHPH